MATPTVELNLDTLYYESVDARERVEHAQAEQHRKRHADQIRNARKIATRVVREALELEIPEAAWAELLDDEADDTYVDTGYPVWVPLGERDGVELRLAFRHRGITAGGDVLTVLGQAPAEEVWVGSRYAIASGADLAGCVDDAIAQARAWDDAVAAELEDPDLANVRDGEHTGPAVKIEGDTLEAVLARAILELVRPMFGDTPTA